MPNKPRTFFSHSLFSHISLYCFFLISLRFAVLWAFFANKSKCAYDMGGTRPKKATNFISQTYQNHLNQHNDEDAEIVIDADNVLVEHCQRCI